MLANWVRRANTKEYPSKARKEEMSEENAGHFRKGHDPRRAVGLRLHNGKTLAQLARENTVEAIELIRSVIVDQAQKTSDRLRAAEYLLDRGWGKAVSVTHIDISDTAEVQELTRDALLAIANGHAPGLPVTIDGQAVSKAVREEEAA
jgi:hypothetical protein